MRVLLRSVVLSLRVVLPAIAAALWLVLSALPSFALEPISVSREDRAVELTRAVELHLRQGDSLRVSTAPDRNGVVRRVEVRSRLGEGTSNWAVFALANDTSEQIDRYIVAPHYRLVGSGLVWPDLDSTRLVSITPSEGFALETVPDRESDVFLITLDPGAVVTLIAELRGERLPKLNLWEPEAYKDTVNSFSLYRGIVLGIAGLLAVFLTILFVVKGSAMLPAAAMLAWAVLAHVCVDFGFWDRVTPAGTGTDPLWRSASEVLVAFGLLLYLVAFLGLHRLHRRISLIAGLFMVAMLLLFGMVLVSPDIASGIARMAIAAVAVLGVPLILVLAVRGYDRAVMLVPSWILVCAWVAAAGLTASGRVTNDVVQPALTGGLVLIVLLLAFTVMQHAFAAGAFAGGVLSSVERQALALTGSGDILWDWDAQRDVVHCGPEAARLLGLEERALTGSREDWAGLLHPNDRDRFRATLETMAELRRGRISQVLRLRSRQNQYHWFTLKARPMLGPAGELVRCIGSLSDVTDTKLAEQRLLHDTVHDNLTGLENRHLFLRRVETLMGLAQHGAVARPSLFHINIDNFREINGRHGYGVGDTILLTAARRLGRLTRTGDSLARLGGDQFVMLLMSETAPDRIAAFADRIRRTLVAPLPFGGQEIHLTASIGVATLSAEHHAPEDLLRDAELAMLQAKRQGGNRIEPFRPGFRTGKDDSTVLLADLKMAIANGEIDVVYQPIMRLENRTVAGYEALVRWHHARLGDVPAADFVPMAERSGLINQLGLAVLRTATRDFRQLADEAGWDDPPYVAINVSSRELLRHDLVADIEAALTESGLAPGALRIELTESLVMENPEASVEVLRRIRALGVGLSMDDFGTGHSSLSYLIRLPFDTLKIDRAFLAARERRERGVVLRAVVAMAHELGLKVVAEGVESEADARELTEIGCEFAQGYLFGAASAFEHLDLPMRPEPLRLAGE